MNSFQISLFPILREFFFSNLWEISNMSLETPDRFFQKEHIEHMHLQNDKENFS